MGEVASVIPMPNVNDYTQQGGLEGWLDGFIRLGNSVLLVIWPHGPDGNFGHYDRYPGNIEGR